MVHSAEKISHEKWIPSGLGDRFREVNLVHRIFLVGVARESNGFMKI